MTTNLPVAAVEAAARALWKIGGGELLDEGRMPQPGESGVADHLRDDAVAVLTAALPHLAPTVDRDTIARALFAHEHPDGVLAWDAPGEYGRAGWRLKADAVLAVLAGGETR